MPPKRSAVGPITSKIAKKIPKLIDHSVKNSVVKDASRSQIQELESALETDGHDPRVRAFVQKMVKSSNLPTNLSIRLLEFCNKVKDEDLAREIISHQSINVNTPDGGRILWEAVNAGNATMASLLIRAGANLTFRHPKDSCTSLHQVLRSYGIKNDAKRVELVQLMIDYGADVNACDSEGYTVLQDSITHEHCSSQIVKKLLKSGADVTFGVEYHLDNIWSAARDRPELLPKLIKHRVANEKMRNQRALLALKNLISRKSTAESLRIMKSILDLGPIINIPIGDKVFRDQPCPLLSIALLHKNKDVIKLLLEHGADPHQKNDYGETPLYQATAFKGYTHASRWMIERGASIHERNNDGAYPIHGACLHNSLRNIHLFVNLGADLNVTDNKGHTPFSYTRETFYYNEAHALVIKHFALIIARGGTISAEDMESANQYIWGAHQFRTCTKQLEQMKVENICDDVSYFALLAENMCSMLRLMKNPAIARNFKRSSKKRAEMFPEYSYMLLHAFEIAEIRYKMLKAEEKKVRKIVGDAMPDHVVENIACYVCFEDLERCQNDYYMSLHESLKNNKADKEKIQ